MVNQKQNIIVSKIFINFLKKLNLLEELYSFKRIIIRNKDFCTEH